MRSVARYYNFLIFIKIHPHDRTPEIEILGEVKTMNKNINRKEFNDLDIVIETTVK